MPRDQTQNRKAIEAVKPHLPANISLFEMEAANVQFLPILLTVTAAVEAGANFIRKKDLLVNKVVIPQTRPEVLDDKIRDFNNPGAASAQAVIDYFLACVMVRINLNR